MHTASAPCAACPAGAAPRVMVLSVWGGAGKAWFARVVMSDAQVHEFASPFELACFLGQPPRLTISPAPGAPGLR